MSPLGPRPPALLGLALAPLSPPGACPGSQPSLRRRRGAGKSGWWGRSRETLGQAPVYWDLTPALTPGPPLSMQLQPSRSLLAWTASSSLHPQLGQEGPSESTPWGSPTCPH